MFPEYGCKDRGKDKQLYAIQRLSGKTRSAVRSERERRKETDALVCCLRRLVIIKFYIFRTLHLRIILVCNQLDAQFLLWYVYLNPLHVSSNYVLILSRTIVLIQHLV
jgi:hypothetical protein